jgi:hypothetical protein
MAEINNVQCKTTNGKVGNQAISTIDFNTWIKDTEVVVKKKKKRKEIVHKIFSDFANIITDTFWIEKFNNASIGKLPTKFSFSNGVLKYKKGNKTYSKELLNSNLETAYECIKFFNTYGLFSNNDISKSNEQIGEIKSEILTWENANENVKELLIGYYINDMMKVMELNKSEVKQLKQTIMMGISLKLLKKTHFFVEENRLIKINNILWDNVNRKFFIDESLKSSIKADNSKYKEQTSNKDINTISLIWDKYINILNNKIEKYNKIIDKKQLSNINSKDNLRQDNSETTPINDFIDTPCLENDVEIDNDCEELNDDEYFDD